MANPNLTRSPSLHGSPAPSPPRKGIPFPTSPPTKAVVEPSIIAAIGENAWLEDERDRKDRAKRELSVIEEKDANLSMSRSGTAVSLSDPDTSGTAVSLEDEGPVRVAQEEDQPTVNEQSEEEADPDTAAGSRPGSGRDSTLEDRESQRTSITA